MAFGRHFLRVFSNKTRIETTTINIAQTKQFSQQQANKYQHWHLLDLVHLWFRLEMVTIFLILRLLNIIRFICFCLNSNLFFRCLLGMVVLINLWSSLKNNELLTVATENFARQNYGSSFHCVDHSVREEAKSFSWWLTSLAVRECIAWRCPNRSVHLHTVRN